MFYKVSFFARAFKSGLCRCNFRFITVDQLSSKMIDDFFQNFLNVKQYFKTLVRRKGSSNQVSLYVTFVHKKSQTFDELDAKLIDDLSEVSRQKSFRKSNSFSRDLCRGRPQF